MSSVHKLSTQTGPEVRRASFCQNPEMRLGAVLLLPGVWMLLAVTVAVKHQLANPGSRGVLAFFSLMVMGFWMSWGVVPLVVGVVGVADGKSGGYWWALILGGLWTIVAGRQVFSEYLIPGLRGELDL